MSAEVFVKFAGGNAVTLLGRNLPEPSRAEAAHEWLDQTYVDLGCEPLRPSGKVLLLDRVLAVAMAAGPEKLVPGTPFASDYAEHVTQALQRSRVTVDIDGLTVS